MFRSSVAAFYLLPRRHFQRRGSTPSARFGFYFLRLCIRTEVEKIIHWVTEILFAAEIAFRRLDGCVPQQELNLTTSGVLGLNWTIAPTDVPTANAIVKRDGAGGFYGNNISANGKLAVGGNAIFGALVGIGTSTPQATLNLNVNGFSNNDRLLVGNNSTRGLQLRDTGTAVDLESIGVPLYVNWATGKSTYFGSLVGIGTATPQALLNVNQGPSANSLLVGGLSKGLLLRDTGTALDLESLGAALWINNTQMQPLYLKKTKQRQT